jgi:hypothetical protein
MKSLISTAISVTFVASIASCAGSTEPGSKADTARPSSREASESAAQIGSTRAASQRPPVVVSVSGPRQVSGDTIDLVVLMERTRPSVSATLNVLLPVGVELVSGALAEEIVGGAARIERVIRVHLPNGVPVSDVQVSADTTGLGFGAHATAAYRFGRAEPTLAQPPRAVAPVIVNGASLGQPIPLR